MRPAEDEWSLIVNKQAELNRIRDQEEQQLQKQSKDLYKQDLSYQSYLKELEREQERKRQETEAQEVKAKAQFFQADSDRRKQEEFTMKKQLAEEYKQQQQELKRKEQEERARKLIEEQQHMGLVRQQLESEDRRKKAMRDAQAQQEQYMMDYKKQQDQLRRQGVQEDKALEQKLTQNYVAKEEMKEQEYRDYYRKVQEAQLVKASQHQQSVTSMQQEKEAQITSWISQNQQSYQQRLAQKEDMERQIRLSALQDANKTIQMQLEEKERLKQQQFEEQRRLQREQEQRLQANREWEEQREAERRLQQSQYREVLAAQSSLNQDIRKGSLRLSEQERRINRSLLDQPGRSTLQNSASQMLKGPDQGAERLYGAATPGANPEFQANAKVFYGAESKPQSAQGPPLGGDWEKNAKVFFGAESKPQSAGINPGTELVGDWEKNAKVFYGAESKPQSAQGTNPYQYASEEKPMDSLRNAAKKFYGAETPETGNRPTKAYQGEGIPAGRKVQPDQPWSLGYQEAQGDPGNFRPKDGKSVYGGEVLDSRNRAGTGPVKGYPIDSVPAGRKVQPDQPWSLGYPDGQQSLDMRQKDAPQSYLSDLPIAGRKVTLDPPLNVYDGFRQETGPPGSSEAYRQHAKRFYGAETPMRPDSDAGGIRSSQRDAQPAGRKIIQEPPLRLDQDDSGVDPTLYDPTVPIRSSVDLPRREYRDPSPAGRKIPKETAWKLASEGDEPPGTSESYMRNAKNFYGAETPLPTTGQRDPVSGGRRTPGDPAWNQNAKAFYGADSRAPSSGQPVPGSQNLPMSEQANPYEDVNAGRNRAYSPMKVQNPSFPAGAPNQREAIDRSEHNPILNPIGRQLPVTTGPRPLYRPKQAQF